LSSRLRSTSGLPIVHSHLPQIRQVQKHGPSLRAVADELNKRGSSINGKPWDVHSVTFVLNRNEQIQRADAHFRLKRQFML
jgi:hypothetical protein